jgi:hypothetical protein
MIYIGAGCPHTKQKWGKTYQDEYKGKQLILWSEFSSHLINFPFSNNKAK